MPNIDDQRMDVWKARLGLRGRGRPRTVEDEVRDNNYRDAQGKYVMSEGLKPWHERVVDYMLVNPNAMIVDVARDFGVSAGWMGQLLKTDAFREYYALRMQDHRGFLQTQVVAKMQGAASKALDVLAKKMDTQDLPVGDVTKIAEVSLKALGFGAAQPSGVNVKIDARQGGMAVVGVPLEAVERAREQLALARKQNTAQQTHDEDAYRQVTASMDKGPEEVDDAVVVTVGNQNYEDE